MRNATYMGAVLLLMLTPALGQPGRPAAKEWDIRAGAGVMMRPTFDGSDRYRARPLPYLSVNWRDTITLDQTGINAQLRRQGYRIGLGLTFDGGREDQDTGGIFTSGDNRLLGMGDIDFAVGLRGFAAWQVGPVEISAQVTKFTGAQNDGLLGRAGLSMPMPLGQSLLLIPSISLGWADDKYMQTFFSVTPLQASRSMLTQFNAASGFQDTKAGMNMVYSFHRNWFATFNVGVSRSPSRCGSSPAQRKSNSTAASAS